VSILTSSLPYLNIVVTLAIVIGGILAFRKGYSQESVNIQDRVIKALKDEVDILQHKVEDLEKERSTQDRIIATIRYALKQHGLRIVINGEFVTLRESGTNRASKSVHIQDKLPIEEDDDEKENNGD
jgi:thiamine monophosphate synthase